MNVGDSFLTATALSELVNARTSAADVVYGDPLRTLEGRSHSPAKVSRYLLFHSGICHQSMVARRSLFSRIGNFDTTLKLGADPDWLLRAHRDKASFMYVPTVVCHYEEGGASADYRERKRYRAIVTKRHFAFPERIVYGTMLFVQKCIRRVMTGNFTLPVSIRDWFARDP
jgi:GT2 family glycosyltransferase